jgi:heme-binding NEAT domain protein
VEVQDIHNTSTKTASLSPTKGGDDEELGGTKVEQSKGEVTPPRDEVDPSKKRKITPPRPSSRKKTKATRTTLKTTLTLDDFDFLIAMLNDVSLELVEKQEAKKEELFHQITGKFKEAQQALQSSQAVSTVSLTMEISGTGDEPTQLHQITEKVEARLRRAQEDIEKATQALAQAQSAHEEKRRKA